MPMNRVDAWRIIQRRAADLGTRLKVGCNKFVRPESLPSKSAGTHWTKHEKRASPVTWAASAGATKGYAKEQRLPARH
jgi:hypothetical protein